VSISPTVEARRWMYATLTADGVISAALGTRLYEVPAPADAIDPFLAIWQFQSPRDLRTNGSILIFTDVYYRVAVAQQGTSVSSPYDLEAIDRRMTLVLDGKSGSTATATILSCVRVGPALLPPDFDKRTGRQYAQLGSDWHVIVQ
jgi:hypothetical protein